MAIPRHTKNQFIAKATKRWGEKYDYRKVIYINSRTPVVIVCNRHDYEFLQTPKAHFTAKHTCCPICYKMMAGIFQNKWRTEVRVINNATALYNLENHEPLFSQVFR